MRVRDFSPVAVAAVAFVYLLLLPLTIGRADESHLLHGALRVLEGEVIYRDFFETLTPLSYYLFAGIYAVAGTTLLAARVGIALVEAIGCGLLFHLTRRVAGPLEALLASAIFVGLCIPAWQYASPHWLSTVLALGVAAWVLSDRATPSDRARPFVAGVLTGVAVCVQQQRGVYLAVWLPLAFAVLARDQTGRVLWLAAVRQTAWAALGCAGFTALVLGPAAWVASPSAVAYALVGFALEQYGPTHGGKRWGVVLPLTNPWRENTWLWLVRASPVFPLVEGLALCLWHRPWRRTERLRACLALLAIMMALSVLYLPDFIHVSFVLPFLLMPALALLHAVRRTALWRARRAKLATAAIVALLVGALWQAGSNVVRAWARAPVQFDTAFGSMRAEKNVANLYAAVRRHVRSNADGGGSLYSYPDDAWLYLALGARNPTRFGALVEDFFTDEQVEEVLQALRARRPETVLLALPFTPERIRRVVEEHYDAVEDVWVYRIYVRRKADGAAG